MQHHWVQVAQASVVVAARHSPPAVLFLLSLPPPHQPLSRLPKGVASAQSVHAYLEVRRVRAAVVTCQNKTEQTNKQTNNVKQDDC